jgi:hypothetical protein
VIRDGKSGFTFFHLEGLRYEYDAASRVLQMTGGRLAITEEFAKSMGRPADAGANVGSVSISTAMRTIEVRNVRNGEDQSAVLPAASRTDAPNAVPGPDVIVGDIPQMSQVGSSGTQVGLAIATTSCNNGDTELNWFANPNPDHPVIPQNFYRMSANGDRFEQVGQSWLKHAFTALQQNVCGTCTSASNGTHLGVGCSDPYSVGNNSNQTGLGSRSWVNPFTGSFPGGTANNHSGHTHNGVSHLILVAQSDLSTTLNPGAAYFAEGQYVTVHEYAWCQGHPGQCNMYNNISYRRFNVTGTTSFSFAANGATVRTSPAVAAWTGATLTTIEPAPGVDGRGVVAYKVTGPVNGVYHYEYAIHNQNLDRGIQSFSVPLGCASNLTNVGFHAPLNHPAWANDNTSGSTGLSNAAWATSQTASSITWNSETFAQNPNANALRWGTLYNFRFDSNRPPQQVNATIGFYKTGEPITVSVQAPSPGCSPLQAVSAVSRKAHGSAGTFDVSLPMTGDPGVEGRRSADGNHTIVFTFSNEVVSGNVTVTEGTGTLAGSPTFSGNTMTVTLTGVPSAQRLSLMLNGVTDSFAQTMPDTTLTMKALFGDTDGNSGVTASDVGRIKLESSNPVTGSNFRSDLTADGSINSSDVGAVKSMGGTVVP